MSGWKIKVIELNCTWNKMTVSAVFKHRYNNLSVAHQLGDCSAEPQIISWWIEGDPNPKHCNHSILRPLRSGTYFWRITRVHFVFLLYIICLMRQARYITPRYKNGFINQEASTIFLHKCQQKLCLQSAENLRS